MATINDGKRKRGCALTLVVAALIVAGLMLSSYLLSLIPAGGFIAVILLCALWILTLIGHISQSAPAWIKGVSSNLLAHKKAAILLSIFLLIVGVAAVGQRGARIEDKEAQIAAAEYKRAKAAEKLRAQKEAEAKKAAELEAKKKELIEKVAYNAEQFKRNMYFIEELVKQKNIEQAVKDRDKLAASINEYKILSDIPKQIIELEEPFNNLSQRVNKIDGILQGVEDLKSTKENIVQMSSEDNSSWDWDQLIKYCQAKLGVLDTIEAAKKDETLKIFIPKSFNIEKERHALMRKIQIAKRKEKTAARKEEVAERKARIAREKEEKAEAAAAFRRGLCGPKPTRSSWDGEYIGIEAAVRRAAHDPDSIDVENCSLIQMTEKNCWVTTCDVRGKNVLGALVLNRLTFRISKLGVEQL